MQNLEKELNTYDGTYDKADEAESSSIGVKLEIGIMWAS
jgi:hypothetical protein